MHLTDITRDIGFKLGYIPPQYNTGEEINPIRMNLGLAWEDFCFPKFHPEVVYHPGEVTRNGIAMTADGISFIGDDGIVHECKLTWKSMAKEIDLQDEWLWLAQTKAYCAEWKTVRARYHIYWVNGSYRRGHPDGGPQYKLYDLFFTQREIDENWKMLLNHSRTLTGKGK